MAQGPNVNSYITVKNYNVAKATRPSILLLNADLGETAWWEIEQPDCSLLLLNQ